MTSRTLFPLPLALCLLWSSSSYAGQAASGAEERSVARELAYSAKTHFDAEEYERAAEDAEAAYRLVPAPTLALLGARAKANLGRWNAALLLYRAAASPTDLSESPALAEARRDAKRELTELEARMPQVRIHQPAREDGQVFIDDHVIVPSTYGVWFPYDPGTHALTWVSSDGERISRNVTFVAGKRQELRITVAADSPGKVRERTWSYVGFGTGAVGVGLGIGLGIAALEQEKQLSDACDGFSCPQQESENIEDYKTLRTASTVSYIAGLTGAAAGGFLLWRSLRSDDEQLQLKLSASLDSLHLSGAF